ncbi:MAG: hypothetical protein JWM54_1489, partial [Acidobacteriaceae bacterium]|nr:hypothetical protein [Acidobacteriaceae bacterium]
LGMSFWDQRQIGLRYRHMGKNVPCMWEKRSPFGNVTILVAGLGRCVFHRIIAEVSPAERTAG